MAAATQHLGIAYDVEGSGAPVLFLHGLTFDRRTWRPIVDRLAESVQCITVDLPGHGQSGGTPAALTCIADRLHELIAALQVERPVVVGHSMSGALATVYAATHPARGLVTVDNGPDIRSFAELLHRLEPQLRGPGFATAWQIFESTLGIDHLAEPIRSLVLDTHEVTQSVVLGYWEQAFRMVPADLQTFVDSQLANVEVPLLAVFGRLVTEHERDRFDRLPSVELEEWVGDGHFVHLVEPDRFANRLRAFVRDCTDTG